MQALFRSLRTPWPGAVRLALVLLLYALYLPLSGYEPVHFQFDAAEYWELSLKFTPAGRFSLLSYDQPVRGYLGPLLVLPARVLAHVTGWSMLRCAQVWGAGWAALLFGGAIPLLWARCTGRALAGGRWLALVALGFVFWRDYFNFTLMDVPALTVLLFSLWALGGRGWGWAALAGLLLAAALNLRPVYLASVPAWAWLLGTARGGQPPGRRRRWERRVLAALLGAALVLGPQLLLNQRHFGRATPLVLAAAPGHAPLYLQQLAWGTRFQRYETSLIPSRWASLPYADSVGQRQLAAAVGTEFATYGQALSFVGRHPVSFVARSFRHLFNGLDLLFPTPYPRRLHPPGQPALRLLNYSLLGIGLWLLVTAGVRHNSLLASHTHRGAPPSLPAAPVLAALVLPCLAALPTLVESRFLLPLHLLLLTGVAARLRWPSRSGPAWRPALAALLLAGWVWGCWQLSAATAGQLRPAREAPE